MKFRKKSEKESCKECSLSLPTTQKEARERLKLLEKKRAKPIPCPYLSDCEEKMLPEVGQILCLDEEIGGRKGRGYMMHMANQHTWMQCKFYAERLRQEKGVLPRDLKKILKAKKKESSKK